MKYLLVIVQAELVWLEVFMAVKSIDKTSAAMLFTSAAFSFCCFIYSALLAVKS